uniref:Uncharacterized protein n=1 Tax=virus sp. ctx9V1 TaxID=2828001 RepID=A0A8S5RCN5_9VIRU|nr:MAG TPA: hypothetical protein [virus sp. ctx9V1]
MLLEILMTKICRNSLKLVLLELIWIMLARSLTK